MAVVLLASLRRAAAEACDHAHVCVGSGSPQPSLAQDYLLGTAQCVFHDIDELVEVVGTSINTRLQAFGGAFQGRNR